MTEQKTQLFHKFHRRRHLRTRTRRWTAGRGTESQLCRTSMRMAGMWRRDRSSFPVSRDQDLGAGVKGDEAGSGVKRQRLNRYSNHGIRSSKCGETKSPDLQIKVGAEEIGIWRRMSRTCYRGIRKRDQFSLSIPSSNQSSCFPVSSESASRSSGNRLQPSPSPSHHHSCS